MKQCIVLLFFSLWLNAQNSNMNLQQVSLHQLIEITSKLTGKNILIPFELKGKVDLISSKSLNHNEMLMVLKKSLHSFGYSLISKGKLFYVDKINDEKSLDMDTVKILYHDAKHILKSLNILLDSKEINVKLSLLPSSNSIAILTSQTHLPLVKSMIQKLDQKTAQVFVKAKILEVNNAKVNKVGVEYGILSAKSSNGDILSFSSSLNSMEGNLAKSVDFSALGLSFPSVQSILSLGASMNLLKQNQAINILSQPSLLCMNNKESSIYVGETKSIKSSSTISDSGTVREQFNRENIGLKLKIKPRIARNKVQLDIHTIIENVSLSTSTNNQPDTFKKEITTTALVDNAQSIVLGGLIEQRNEHSNNNVPGLSAIPVLGELFKNKNSNESQKSLLIVITPYIIPSNKSLVVLHEELSKMSLLEEQFLEEKLKSKQKNQKQEEKNLSAEEKFKAYFES